MDIHVKQSQNLGTIPNKILVRYLLNRSSPSYHLNAALKFSVLNLVLSEFVTLADRHWITLSIYHEREILI